MSTQVYNVTVRATVHLNMHGETAEDAARQGYDAMRKMVPHGDISLISVRRQPKIYDTGWNYTSSGGVAGFILECRKVVVDAIGWLTSTGHTEDGDTAEFHMDGIAVLVERDGNIFNLSMFHREAPNFAYRNGRGLIVFSNKRPYTYEPAIRHEEFGLSD